MQKLGAHLVRDLAVLVVVSLLASCVSTAPASRHGDMRVAILDLIHEQIVDNLIRIRRGMPILHVDYTTVTATATLKSSASASITIDSGTDPVALGGQLEFTDQIQLVARPLAENRQLYSAYLAFKALRDGPRAPSGKVHVHREVGGHHYWISSTEADRRAYLRLALSVTGLRGQEASLPEAYSASIESVEEVASADPGVLEFKVELSRAIPNDTGTAEVVLSDRRVIDFYLKISADSPPGSELKTLSFRRNKDSEPVIPAAELVPLMRRGAATIRLDYYSPKPPSESRLFEELELLRLVELGASGGTS